MAGDSVQQIKDRLSIVDVVGQVVKLRKAGRSYVGLCPFHKEKTPSFHVSLERGSYHCFGCGEGGDIFSFVEKTEGVDFKGALKMLAERTGVTLEYSGGGDKKAKDRAERLREAMARAATFYQSQLVEGDLPAGRQGAAYSYALSRGLHEGTIKEWGLGFAPDAWRALLEHLAALGFTNEELLAAGLIKEADGKPGTYYDRFRARLMFPIRDTAGRVVAFTGRALAADEQAKYLNSPDTELYHKSEILFGLDRAKDSIRLRGFALLVEGQMDLLMAHQAGFSNVVAVSGTAFTESHAKLLKRYAENLMLCLDADKAGLAASNKAALIALSIGMQVKAARLPEGKDPADLITEDQQEFAKRVKEGRPVVEFFLAELAAREKDPHRLVRHAERLVLPLIAAMKSPMEREHFAAVAARALGLSPEAVKESLARLPREAAGSQGSTLKSDPKGRTLEPRAAITTTNAREVRERTLRAIPAAYPRSALAERVKSEYNRVVDAPLTGEASEADIFSTEAAFGEDPPVGAADDLIRAFEEAYIREAYQEKIGELRRAEVAQDSAAVKAAERAVEEFSKRLRALAR